MKLLIRFTILALCATTAFAAEPFRAGDITVSGAWTRATPPGAPAAGVYMTLRTAGAADRLVSVESPAAGRGELHTMSMDGGVMRMRPVEAIEIKPGAATELKPGGLHVMLMGLKEPLKEGAAVKLTLKFEKAGALEVTVPVAKMGAAGPGMGHHKH